MPHASKALEDIRNSDIEEVYFACKIKLFYSFCIEADKTKSHDAKVKSLKSAKDYILKNYDSLTNSQFEHLIYNCLSKLIKINPTFLCLKSASTICSNFSEDFSGSAKIEKLLKLIKTLKDKLPSPKTGTKWTLRKDDKALDVNSKSDSDDEASDVEENELSEEENDDELYVKNMTNSDDESDDEESSSDDEISDEEIYNSPAASAAASLCAFDPDMAEALIASGERASKIKAKQKIYHSARDEIDFRADDFVGFAPEILASFAAAFGRPSETGTTSAASPSSAASATGPTFAASASAAVSASTKRSATIDFGSLIDEDGKENNFDTPPPIKRSKVGGRKNSDKESDHTPQTSSFQNTTYKPVQEAAEIAIADKGADHATYAESGLYDDALSMSGESSGVSEEFADF